MSYRVVRTETFHHTSFEVKLDQETVAHTFLHPVSEEGDGPWISGVYVDPEHRGRGLVRLMFAEVEKAYPGQILRLRARPYVDKAVDTQGLVSLYERLGFTTYDDQHRMLKKVQR